MDAALVIPSPQSHVARSVEYAGLKEATTHG